MARLRWMVRSPLVALLAIAVVLGVQVPHATKRPLTDFDQHFYLGIAYDQVHSGRFTNGYAFAEPGPDRLRPSGMRFAPLYPSLLALVSRVDGGLRRGMDCLVESKGGNPACPNHAPIMRGLQFAELVCVFWLVWWMGSVISGSALLGWVALGLALLTAPFLLRSVTQLMTEMTCLLATTGATACFVRNSASGRAGWAACSGALLALAALTRPGNFYLFDFCVLVLAGMAVQARLARKPLVRAACFAAAGAGVLVPWLVRNTLVLGRTALTFGYDSNALVQRIAFDTMSWRDYGRSYVCWLPGGRLLGNRLFGPHACDPFGWDEQPDSFYVLGLRRMLDQTLAASGGYEHHLGYLLRTYILGAPLTHLAVTVPLALRGAYISHWWGFVLLWVSLAWTGLALAGRAPRGFLILAVPAWFMLAFNALVAVNQVRYNLMLIPPYAVAGALALHAAYRVWLTRRRSRQA